MEQALANLTEAINKQTIVLERIVELVGIEVEQAVKNMSIPAPTPTTPVPAPPTKTTRTRSAKKEPTEPEIVTPTPPPANSVDDTADIDELMGVEENELDFGQEEEDVFAEAKAQTNAFEMFKLACKVLTGPKRQQGVLVSKTKSILASLGVNDSSLSTLPAKKVEAFKPLFFAVCEELYAQGI